KVAYGLGEHLSVRVVDARRLHGLTRWNDLVAGREDGDHRLSPDINRGDADRGEHAGVAGGQTRAASRDSLTGGDIGAGERDATAGGHGPADAQFVVGLARAGHYIGVF